MTEKPKIYFRADGNHKVGHGHVIRSLALADMLKKEFECNFIIVDPSESIKTEITSICHSLITLTEGLSLQEEARYIERQYLCEEVVIVLDGYNFETEYQRTLKSSGCKIVCIDDIHTYHFLADVIINHAPGVNALSYSKERRSKLCLGLNYSILREPFLNAANEFRRIESINTLFLCFGGSDVHNLTSRILKCVIKNIPQISKIIVVIGSSNRNYENLNSIVEESYTVDVSIYRNLSARQMCSKMKEADLAIVPSSSILCEILSIRMPVISGYYADNQMNLHSGFRDLKAIYSIGDFRLADNYKEIFDLVKKSEIDCILNTQKEYINGRSKYKIVRLFKSLHKTNGVIEIRSANHDDLIQYYEWASDPSVRENSFSPSEIYIDDHRSWFSRKLNQDNCFMYIFEIERSPIGQVRFDILEGNAIIDYSIDSSERGSGFGQIILSKGIERLKSEWNGFNLGQIQGIVKESNISSIRTFEKLGFTKERKLIKGNVPCVLFAS